MGAPRAGARRASMKSAFRIYAIHRFVASSDQFVETRASMPTHSAANLTPLHYHPVEASVRRLPRCMSSPVAMSRLEPAPNTSHHCGGPGGHWLCSVNIAMSRIARRLSS